MSRDTDPLSLALSCVRRLSDEGLEALRVAVRGERAERHRTDLASAFASARWFTAFHGRNGYRAHLVAEGHNAAIRASAQSGGHWHVSAMSICGVTLRGGTPNGEPTCPKCLKRWTRPA